MKAAPRSPSLLFSAVVCAGVLGTGAGGVAATAFVGVADAVVVVLIVADLHPTSSVTATKMIGMNLRIMVQSNDKTVFLVSLLTLGL